MGNWETWLPQIVATIIVFIGGMATAKARASADNAQATAVNVDTFQKLIKQVQDLTKEVGDVRDEVADIKDKNRVLWQYVYGMIEHMRRHKVKPLPPPRELESDPVLMKLIKDMNGGGEAGK